jgi:hypothetical protein
LESDSIPQIIFPHTRQRPDRAPILDEWIERVIQTPLREEIHLTDVFAAGRELRRWETAFCESFCSKMAKLSTMPFLI